MDIYSKIITLDEITTTCLNSEAQQCLVDFINNDIKEIFVPLAILA